MKTDKQFPVSTGTVLSLSCNEGYELKGDKTVACTTSLKFQFSVEPNCGEFIWLITCYFSILEELIYTLFFIVFKSYNRFMYN